ncbi:lysine--tRNA ligase [Candidatus Dependentiae bacterium]
MNHPSSKSGALQEDLSKEHEIRVSKVSHLRDAGIEAWPEFKEVASQAVTLREIGKKLKPGEESKEAFTFAGRTMAKRGHGKTMFCNLQDITGTLQVYFKKDLVGEKPFENLENFLDVGDIIWVSGSLFLTKTGEPTIKVNEWTLLSKCLHPLPEKHHGLTDTEQRYRQRYLDLISNSESKERFIARSKIVQSIRKFLTEKNFLEVETPMLQPIPGGASARPFVTHHNAYDIDLYLRIAPELYLKRLVVGGLERVFEINRSFRNEGVSTKHNPEFTMLEFYMAHGNYQDGIKNTEELIRTATKNVSNDMKVSFGEHVLDFSKPFEQMTILDSIVKIGGVDKDALSETNIDSTMKENSVELYPGASHGEKLFALFEELVEHKIVQPTFIIGYPIEVSPLAKRDPKDKNVAARFELFVAGMELANGFTELNDPFDQAERFKKQVEARERGDEEAQYFDADYVRALEYGLPPTVGVGIGIDRLVMFLTNTPTIKDIILFPTMKPKSE